jgi:hypothetical protein
MDIFSSPIGHFNSENYPFFKSKNGRPKLIVITKFDCKVKNNSIVIMKVSYGLALPLLLSVILSLSKSEAMPKD